MVNDQDRAARLARGLLRMKEQYFMNAGTAYPLAGSANYWRLRWQNRPSGRYPRLVHDHGGIALAAQDFTRVRSDQERHWSRLFRAMIEHEGDHEPALQGVGPIRERLQTVFRADQRAQQARVVRARRNAAPMGQARDNVVMDSDERHAYAMEHAVSAEEMGAFFQELIAPAAAAAAAAAAAPRVLPDATTLRNMSGDEFVAARDAARDKAMKTARLFESEHTRRQRVESLVADIEDDDESPFKHFMCPITHDIMNDPVIAMDGFNYERVAIERVINGKSTFKSPKTRAVVDSVPLIPNNDLKGQILEKVDTMATEAPK